MDDVTEAFPLRVRSHILRLLGDQLVGHDRLAIFELVKNAYDADATKVEVTLNIKERKITVTDNGHGMTGEVIKSKWLDIGTDSKRGSNRTESPKFRRLPLGEKGVGRLAVQKLGDKFRMTTKSEGAKETVVDVTWNNLIGSSDYIENESLKVEITERSDPVTFKDGATGTLIEISDLVRREWAKKDLRDLKRLVVSLESPFKAKDSITVSLKVPGREKDIDDVPDLKELLKRSVWVYDFELNEEGFNWTYKFSPPRLKNLKENLISSVKNDKLEWCDDATKAAKSIASSSDEVPIFVDLSKDLNGVGKIHGRFHVFYNRDEVLRLIGDPRQTKQWLKDQSGVRVFRDGIRVYNYGEPDDDWLGLNARRINRPTAKLGTSQLVAAIELDLSTSTNLREKTNREGFDSNETFDRFRNIILSTVEHFEKLHDEDRRTIDHALKTDDVQAGVTIKLSDAITGLKKVCSENKELSKTLNSYVSVIEEEVEQVKSVMLNAGMAGMGLALVFHEIDRSIRTLTSLAEQGVSPEKLRTGLRDLSKMLDSISVLMRQGRSSKLSIREVIKLALELNESRFKFHGIVVSSPIASGESPDFFVTAPQHLILSALNNLIDNAIYWAEHKVKNDNLKDRRPAIFIDTSWTEEYGGTLTVADNGAGFTISTADATQPFITKRTGGMGLGLYYCRLVMENVGGELKIGSTSDARDYMDIPDPYDGAAVTLLFPSHGDE